MVRPATDADGVAGNGRFSWAGSFGYVAGISALSSVRSGLRSADVAGHGVDRDRDGEDQDRIDSLRDLDAVRVAHPEPLLGHLGDLVAVAFDLVLVVDDVAVDLQVGLAVDIDLEVVADPDDPLGHVRGPTT